MLSKQNKTLTGTPPAPLTSLGRWAVSTAGNCILACFLPGLLFLEMGATAKQDTLPSTSRRFRHAEGAGRGVAISLLLAGAVGSRVCLQDCAWWIGRTRRVPPLPPN